MKLLRYGPRGQEKPGLRDKDGNLRDLSGHIADITPDTLDAGRLKDLARIDPTTLPIRPANSRLGVPINGIRKFLAVGLNYADHAAEANLPVPTEPVVFTKQISCLNGPNDDIMLPEHSTKGDWEVELGIVIGREARCVSPEQASSHIAGYCLANDVSEREWQMERGPTWDKGKGFDTFGPIGPWLVTADEIPDPQNLNLWLDLNGRRMQTGNTKTMIFDVRKIVAYVSRLCTLWPGDLIITGTPPGVGMGCKPPVHLKPGDTLCLGIDGLGEQTQKVVAFSL
jgi:2,4-diketo-3-deoxy-L-fuconate hydrolase